MFYVLVWSRHLVRLALPLGGMRLWRAGRPPATRRRGQELRAGSSRWGRLDATSPRRRDIVPARSPRGWTNASVTEYDNRQNPVGATAQAVGAGPCVVLRGRDAKGDWERTEQREREQDG
ncbi:MAG: hypothetical protein BroJett030_22600 [Alphaproteobacteria bacterium]|nr:MAG: hypothetical protein BroJett030_22600 [Alphaproteobacteria bacterium]